jgi:hypothetical protein
MSLGVEVSRLRRVRADRWLLKFGASRPRPTRNPDVGWSPPHRWRTRPAATVPFVLTGAPLSCVGLLKTHVERANRRRCTARVACHPESVGH